MAFFSLSVLHARFLSFAVHSPNSNILNKALSAIEEFYKYTGNESIYEKRCELLNILANNKNISNLTLNDIILYNSDAFSSEEFHRQRFRNFSHPSR